MRYVIIFIYIFLFWFSWEVERRRYKSHATPLFVFVDVWCIVGIGSNLCFFDYFEPSTLVNLFMIIMIIIFMIIWIVRVKDSDIIEEINTNIEPMQYCLFVLLALEIISLAIAAPKLRDYVKLILTYGMNGARSATLSGLYVDNVLRSILIDMFVVPFFTVTSLMAAWSLIVEIKKKQKVILWVIAIFNVVIFSLMTAGRILLVNLIFYVLFAVDIKYGRTIFNILRRMWKFSLLFILMICGMLLLQYLRSPDMSILKTLYMYYFSGPMYLSELIKRDTTFIINSDFMFGCATFGFITNLFSYAITLITHKSQGSLYMLGSVLTNQYYNVGIQTRVNAMCTCIYDFLLDWGYFGVFLGPVIIAFLTIAIYKYAARNQSFVGKCLLLYSMNILIRTVFKWDLINPNFPVVVIYLIILYKSSKIRLHFK